MQAFASMTQMAWLGIRCVKVTKHTHSHVAPHTCGIRMSREGGSSWSLHTERLEPWMGMQKVWTP